MTNIFYFFYHNPQRNPHITIHKSSCGHCKFGKGKHKDVLKGLNCVWTGPFYNLEWAIKYIENNIKKTYNIQYCNHCFKNSTL